MTHVPLLRWGQPYKSLDTDKVVHFDTGEQVCEVSQANGGMIRRDMRKAQDARNALREIPCTELLKRMAEAGRMFTEDELPIGDDPQSPEDFARQQSATVGAGVGAVAVGLPGLIGLAVVRRRKAARCEG